MSLAVSYAQRLAASSAVDDRDFYMGLTGSSTSRHVAALLLGDRTCTRRGRPSQNATACLAVVV